MGTRTYRSELREAQAAATHERILEAAVAVLATGVTELSIPTIADEAGVSVATVYRHFGDKAGLVAEIPDLISRRLGLTDLEPPTDLEGLADAIRTLFAAFDEADDVIAAALATAGPNEARSHVSGMRLALFRSLFADVEPPIPADAVEHLARLTVVLTQSSALRSWRNHFDLTHEEVADEVIWAIRAMVAGSRA